MSFLKRSICLTIALHFVLGTAVVVTALVAAPRTAEAACTSYRSCYYSHGRRYCRIMQRCYRTHYTRRCYNRYRCYRRHYCSYQYGRRHCYYRRYCQNYRQCY